MYAIYIHSFWRKKYFLTRKTFATEELYILMGINFRECYQIKYFAVPTFANLPKNRETLIRESFIL